MLLETVAFVLLLLTILLLLLLGQLCGNFCQIHQGLTCLTFTKTSVESTNQNIKIVGGNKRSQADKGVVVELRAVKRLKLELPTDEQIVNEKMLQMKALGVKLEYLERMYADAVAAHHKLLAEEREFLALISAKYQKQFSVSTLEN